MSLTLLLPAALAALAALLLPLAVHLARRDETRPTVFAALRWLSPKPQPRQRVRFDEWPLLVLRLLLLAGAAVLLARPALLGRVDATPWLAVVPGLDPVQARAGTGDVDARWLAAGFPALDQPPPAGPIPVASLLRQLDAELPPQARLTVVVPAEIDGADAERPRLSRTVDWRIVPGAMPAPRAVPDRVPALTVRTAPGRESALRFLRAAAIAWQPAGNPPAFTAGPAVLPTGRTTLVWLTPGPLPNRVRRWIAAGGTALLASDTAFDRPVTVVWRDEIGAPIVATAALGRGRVLHLTRPFTPPAMPQLLQPEFPEQLRALLTPPPAPARVDARDYAPRTGGPRFPPPAEDLRPWLALLIAALWLAERWLATSRSRGVAP